MLFLLIFYQLPCSVCRTMKSSGITLANTWNWVALKTVRITNVLPHCFGFTHHKVMKSLSAWMNMLRTWNRIKRIFITLLLTVWIVQRTHLSWRNLRRRNLKYKLVFIRVYIFLSTIVYFFIYLLVLLLCNFVGAVFGGSNRWGCNPKYQNIQGKEFCWH